MAAAQGSADQPPIPRLLYAEEDAKGLRDEAKGLRGEAQKKRGEAKEKRDKADQQADLKGITHA
eukprot:3673888-Amphidinium_carterae.1